MIAEKADKFSLELVKEFGELSEREIKIAVRSMQLLKNDILPEMKKLFNF